MRKLVSSLVALSISLHTVLGCCWHHAHAEAATVEVQAEHAEAESATACVIVPVHCGCRHHRPAQQAPALPKPVDPAADHQGIGHAASHTDHPPHPEKCPGPCAEKCVVVVSHRADLEYAAAADWAFGGWSVEPVAPACNAFSAQFAFQEAWTHAPPARLHLLYQLLLI